MRVQTTSGTIELGDIEASPTIGITDYSRRVTDDFGTTTVVERGFSRRMSVRLKVPFDDADALQRRLADLRATAATWIADDQLRSLQVRGFYRDFEIDLAVPPVSFCTLSVEGLAETDPLTDAGGDPAPDGLPSTLRLLQPVAITDAALKASNVPENDAPAWSSGTTYATKARVIRAHRVWESVAIGNADDPTAGAGKWLDVGPTNRWAAFDQALGTATKAAGPITITLDAGKPTAVALLDVVATSVRVQAPGYDRTTAVGTGAVTFLDLPGASGQVTVTIAGSGQLSVGTLLIGSVVGLGITEASPTAGITDYSRKETDDFGAVTIVQRAWAKTMTARAIVRTDAVDAVMSRLVAVRATPSLWIGQSGVDSLTVYGFFREFGIEVGSAVSKLSLTIEGLSTAAAVAPLKATVDWPDVGDPDGTKPDNNATNGGDPNSPLGPNGTVKDTLDRIAAIRQVVDGLPDDVGAAIAAIRAKTRDGAPNLIANTDGRDDLNRWVKSGSGWSVVQQSANGSYFQNVGGGVGAYMYQDVPASEGVAYSYSYEGDPDAANDRLYLQFWSENYGKVLLSAPGISADGWARAASDPVVAPTGTRIARLVYDRPTTAGALRGTRFQLQAGAATAWNDAADGYVVTALVRSETEQRKGDAAALAGRADTLDAQVAGNAASGLKTQLQGQITDTRQAAADASTAAAQVQTNLSAAIRPGSINLLVNPDFKDGLNGWGSTGGWAVGTSARVGTYAYHQSRSGSSDLDLLAQDVPVDAGTSYSISYEGNPYGRTGQQAVWFDWIDAKGQLAGEGRGASLFLPAQDFAFRGSATSGPAPANAVKARVYVVCQQNSNHNATRVQLQAGPATAWRDDTSIRAIVATATQQAGVIAKADGRTKAYLQQTATAGNGRAQLTLYAEDGDGVSRGGVDIVGDVTITGDASIDGDVVIAGTLKTASAADNQFSNIVTVQSAQSFQGDGGSTGGGGGSGGGGYNGGQIPRAQQQ